MSKFFSLIAATVLIMTTSFAAEGELPNGDKPEQQNPDPNKVEITLNSNDYPELVGIDPKTPEGQAVIQSVMQKEMKEKALQIRQHLATSSYSDLSNKLGATSKEFSTIKHLLVKVETLLIQRSVIDQQYGLNPNANFDMSKSSSLNTQRNGAKLEPTVAEIQAALKIVMELFDDKLVNIDVEEAKSSVERLHKARADFAVVLANAQADLRAVLTPQQVLVLICRGTLE